MISEKFKKDLIAAQRILALAAWGDCTCYKCTVDRLRKSMPQALSIVYPTMPIVPIKWEYDEQSRFVFDILKMAAEVRQSNKEMSEYRDGLDKEEGQECTPLFFCRNCGKLHFKGDKIDDMPMCEPCFKQLSKCGICGKVCSSNGVSNAKIDSKVVKTCTKCCGNLGYCNYCGYFVENKYIINYDVRRMDDGSMEVTNICDPCNSKHKFTCKCGEVSHPMVSRTGCGGSPVCPACMEEEKGMQPYYFKPLRLHFNSGDMEGKVTENAFHMGFEIEIAMKYSTLDQTTMSYLLKEKFGNDRIYCMRDGTIKASSGYPGLEVVSHPFTWGDYKKQACKWDEMLIYLREKGWSANFKGVGFHVHTTKSAWGSFQIYKLLQLIYKNKTWTCQIAQRKPTAYCAMSPKDFDAAALVAKDKKNCSADHYSAINLNNGNGSSSKTIEFRMFQGSLEPLYFHKNIEFVRACYQYTKNFRDTSVSAFTAYTRKNNREYPCLNEFLNMKGL